MAMNDDRLTSEEREEARLLGVKLVELLTSKGPLIAGFALAAVIRGMPPTFQEVFDFARQRIMRAMEWSRKNAN